MLLQEMGSSDDKARRAEATLLRIVIDESLHYRREGIALGEAFDGRDLLAPGRR